MILLRMTKILQWFRAKYNSWLPLIIWGECSFSHKIMRFVWFDSLCVLHITLFHTSTHTEPTRQYRSKRMQEERRRKNCLYEQYAEQQITQQLGYDEYDMDWKLWCMDCCFAISLFVRIAISHVTDLSWEVCACGALNLFLIRPNSALIPWYSICKQRVFDFLFDFVRVHIYYSSISQIAFNTSIWLLIFGRVCEHLFFLIFGVCKQKNILLAVYFRGWSFLL